MMVCLIFKPSYNLSGTNWRCNEWYTMFITFFTSSTTLGAGALEEPSWNHQDHIHFMQIIPNNTTAIINYGNSVWKPNKAVWGEATKENCTNWGVPLTGTRNHLVLKFCTLYETRTGYKQKATFNDVRLHIFMASFAGCSVWGSHATLW
jgi:hypothetical protein